MTRTADRARSRRSAIVATDGRTLTVRLAAYDVLEAVHDGGRNRRREGFRRGGMVLEPGSRLLAELDHDGPVVGRMTDVDVEPPPGEPPGFYVDVAVANTPAGDEVLALHEVGAMWASIDYFADADTAAAAETWFTSDNPASLDRFAFTSDPQYAGAAIVGRRSHHTGDPTMPATDETTTDDVDEEVGGSLVYATADDVDETTTADDVDEPPAESRNQRSHRGTGDNRQSPRPRGGARSSGRFRSLGHFVRAVANDDVDGDELVRYRRALDSGTAAANTGLVHDEWIRDVIDLQRAVQPTVSSFARRPLPESGLTVQQPKVTTRPTVATQSPEGSEVSSQAVVITPTPYTVITVAGGQNMSLQAIRRSDPSYLDQVMRLHVQEMAEELNRLVVAGVVAAIPAGNTITATASFNDDVVDAAAGMLGHPGAPSLKRFPELVLLSTQKWQALAKETAGDGRPLYPTISPTNPVGTVSLTDREGMIRNLRYEVEPELAGDDVVVGVAAAYQTMTGEVMTLSADVVSTLGRDVAVAQFAAHGETDDRGLYLIHTP